MKHFIVNGGFEERHLFQLIWISLKKKSLLQEKVLTSLEHRNSKGISKENVITWPNSPSFIDRKSDPRKVITSQGHKAVYWRMESKIQVS